MYLGFYVPTLNKCIKSKSKSIELVDGLCENRDQVILTGDFNTQS